MSNFYTDIEQNSYLAGHYAVSELYCEFFLLLQVLIKGFGVHLRDLCNTTSLEEFVNIADHNVSEMTQKIICQSPADWLNTAESHFLSNLDFLKPIRVRRVPTPVTRVKDRKVVCL